MQPNYYALGNQKIHDLLYCEDSTSPMHGTQVQSLVVELKFHMPHGTAKNKEKKMSWTESFLESLNHQDTE